MTYTFALSRRSLPMRCLCVLLCVLVLWCFFMVPRAGAVVAEAELAYWGGAIIVSVLAAGGMALATGDAQKVGSAMYGALKDTGGKAWDSVCSLASWAAAAGSKAKDAAFRVGKDVWQAISDLFNKSYSDGKYSLPVSADSGFYVLGNDDFKKALSLFPLVNSYKSLYFHDLALTFELSSDFVEIFDYGTSRGGYSIPDEYSLSQLDANFYLYDFYGDGSAIGYGIRVTASGQEIVNKKINGYRVSSHPWVGTYPAGGEKVAVTGDLVYPSDDYLVKVPDIPATDSVTGALAWPSDAVYTKDAIAVPYPVDSEGVKVPDIPYDKALDKSTGKTLDDTDTGTDTKPGEDTDTGASTAGLIGSIIELLKNFFDSPSDFKLNFDGFKNLILPDRFPFCIPFDMVKAVKLFAATAADFVFKIDLDTQFFSVHHTVDLTPYAVPIAFFRYACVFWFAWILLSRTRDLMKW